MIVSSSRGSVCADFIEKPCLYVNSRRSNLKKTRKQNHYINIGRIEDDERIN